VSLIPAVPSQASIDPDAGDAPAAAPAAAQAVQALLGGKKLQGSPLLAQQEKPADNPSTGAGGSSASAAAGAGAAAPGKRSSASHWHAARQKVGAIVAFREAPIKDKVSCLQLSAAGVSM
jgi:hypothetical protein